MESGQRAGKVIEYRGHSYHILQFDHGCRANSLFTPAAAVDGLLMATQLAGRFVWRLPFLRYVAVS
ncbi:hypothetical protein J7E23_12275 [Pseudomonas sp. ISL-88]|uniref:glycosyltransferase family protein n=1 Tax=Pseudomonas sp. ISL-88 TaxID=2819169 RepID=UPI001BE9016E|nr:glycosyltransferase family protein [Pseudomonas sp. ISL-88]MBT2713622.1 hypothetical protein [Pseudomonas sp. ISL-88]